MSNSPDSSKEQRDIDSKESEQPSWELSLHYLNNLLDVLVCHLCSSNWSKVKNCCPTFDLAGYHGLIDNMVEKVWGGSNNIVNLFRHCQNHSTLYDNHWSHTNIPFKPINNPWVQHLFNWIKLQWIRCYCPTLMLCDCGDGLIIFPFLSLENSEDKSCVVIIACWNFNILFFAKVTESFQLRLFFIS